MMNYLLLLMRNLRNRQIVAISSLLQKMRLCRKGENSIKGRMRNRLLGSYIQRRVRGKRRALKRRKRRIKKDWIMGNQGWKHLRNRLVRCYLEDLIVMNLSMRHQWIYQDPIRH
jgi:hypothetical protein